MDSPKNERLLIQDRRESSDDSTNEYQMQPIVWIDKRLVMTS